MSGPLSQKKTANSSQPSKNEGSDGEQRFVKKSGTLFMYRKHEGIWYKIQMEKV